VISWPNKGNITRIISSFGMCGIGTPFHKHWHFRYFQPIWWLSSMWFMTLNVSCKKIVVHLFYTYNWFRVGKTCLIYMLSLECIQKYCLSFDVIIDMEEKKIVNNWETCKSDEMIRHYVKAHNIDSSLIVTCSFFPS